MVPPLHYYEACLFDSCFVPNVGLECASVQIYAALCAQEGVCLDWRDRTNGVCRKCLFVLASVPVLGSAGQTRVSRLCWVLGPVWS